MFGTRSARRVAIFAAGLIAVLGLTSAVQAATQDDFDLTVAPTSRNISPGSSSTFTITLTRQRWFNSSVTLTTSAPSGLSTSLTADAVNLGPGAATASSGLTVSVPPLFPGGAYTLTVTGSGGGATHSTTVQVVVPGVQVQLNPNSRNAVAGSNAVYQVKLTSIGGFSGRVGLSAPDGLLAGITATFVPATPTVPANGTTVVDLTIATVSAVPLGSYPFTVAASDGRVRGTVTGVLVIRSQATVSVSASPSSRVIAPGATASYALTVTRTGITGSASPTVSGIPVGATASLSPDPIPGSSAALNITTSASTPAGRYIVTVTVVVGSISSSTSVTLVVEQPGVPFDVGGPVGLTTLLAPGVTVPLNLSITNSNTVPVHVTALKVTIAGTDKAGCERENYTSTPYSGGGFTVAAGATDASLQQLGIPQTAWPTLTMIDLPTTNQDACKGAQVSLSYAGIADGGVTS